MANVTASMESVAKTTLWQSNESSYLKLALSLAGSQLPYNLLVPVLEHKLSFEAPFITDAHRTRNFIFVKLVHPVQPNLP